MRRRGTPVSREALYEAVWADAVTVVAPRYGLSDVGLVKICKKLGIPVPPRGYWAKVKARRPTHKLPLPSLTAGARGSGALEAARRLGSSGRRERRAKGSARPADHEEHPRPRLAADGHAAQVARAPRLHPALLFDCNTTSNAVEQRWLKMKCHALRELAGLVFQVRM